MMKHIIHTTAWLLLLLLCMDNKSYAQLALKDSLYIHLDTSRISSGFVNELSLLF